MTSTSTDDGYCCPMRRHFLVGVVGTRAGSEAPSDVVDFVLDWEPRIVMAIKFCPFCGGRIARGAPLRTPLPEEPTP